MSVPSLQVPKPLFSHSFTADCTSLQNLILHQHRLLPTSCQAWVDSQHRVIPSKTLCKHSHNSEPTWSLSQYIQQHLMVCTITPCIAQPVSRVPLIMPMLPSPDTVCLMLSYMGTSIFISVPLSLQQALSCTLIRCFRFRDLFLFILCRAYLILSYISLLNIALFLDHSMTEPHSL